MTALYVTVDGATVRKRGERLLVESPEGEALQELELRGLEGVVILNTVQVTTQALTEMLEHGVELAILTRNAKLLGQLTPPLGGNIQLRKRQFEKERDPAFCLRIATSVIAAKVENQRQVLVRFEQDQPGDQPEVRQAADAIKALAPAVARASDLGTLRGLEGACARAYWGGFAHTLTAEGVQFCGRKRHPSPDPVNAVLSFGYVLLSSALHSLLDGLGFDPFLGFFHEESYGRASLALDLLEPFRAPVIDRMTIRMFNLRMLKPDGFEPDGEGGVRLRPDALRVFFREYEKTMLGLKVRQAIREQAEALRRVFLGEEDSIEFYRWSAR
jgi:CRISPR-associated protein Cas1